MKSIFICLAAIFILFQSFGQEGRNSVETKHVPFMHRTNHFLCEGDSLFLGGEWRKEAGIFQQGRRAYSINYFESYQFNNTITISEGDSALIFGFYHTNAGVYGDPYTTVDGCDSVYTTVLIMKPAPKKSNKW